MATTDQFLYPFILQKVSHLYINRNKILVRMNILHETSKLETLRCWQSNVFLHLYFSHRPKWGYCPVTLISQHKTILENRHKCMPAYSKIVFNIKRQFYEVNGMLFKLL